MHRHLEYELAFFEFKRELLLIIDELFVESFNHCLANLILFDLYCLCNFPFDVICSEDYIYGTLYQVEGILLPNSYRLHADCVNLGYPQCFLLE